MRQGPKILAPLLVVCLTFSWAHAAFALGGFAALEAGDMLAHPALAGPGQPTFTVYQYAAGTGREAAMNAAGFFMDDPARQTMVSPFAVDESNTFAGKVYSEVWQYDGISNQGDGHLVFLYRVENTSDPAFPAAHDFHTASVYGEHWGGNEISDCGIIRPESSLAFVPNDLSMLGRPGPGVTLAQLGRWFPLDLIRPGEASPWFYFETPDAFQWSYGSAQVNGNIGSAHPVPVFAPAPEPGTMILLAAGSAGLVGYIRRRRGLKA